MMVRGGATFGAVWDASQRLVRLALDFLMPPRCLCCGALVSEPGALCPNCWGRIGFLEAPFCVCCGSPFEFDVGPDALCVRCLTHPPRFDRARAVFRYDETSRALILRFKHADRTAAAPSFARWMARAGRDLLADADLLLPVPLHRWRLLRRRYNQAALLAWALSRQTGVSVDPLLLRRERDTSPQGRMTRKERRRNVRGAFALSRPEQVRGKKVVLIDDVLTTGATIDECARILKAAGAERVDVLTLAKVFLGESRGAGH